MTRQSIRLILLLASISLIGLGLVQWYWLNKAFDQKEQEFNESVTNALTSTAQRMLDYNQNKTKLLDPVKQESDDYFLVRVDDVIDAGLLEIFLREEFQKRRVNLDYEYGIYDCSTDRMVYGNFVSQSPDSDRPPSSDLPKWKNQNYYFGIRFPSLGSNLVSQMGIWLFSTGVLAFVAVFMIIAMIMILKQKRLSEIQKDFINNMTHEFKTPLSSILASEETLRNMLAAEGKPTDRVLRYLGIIHTEGKRLQSQVEAVLKMTNFETTRLRKEKLDLVDLVRKLAEAQEPALQAVQGKLELQMPEEPIWIWGDALHLTNVFSNLIDNALKYNQGKPEIHISVQPTGQNVMIKVNDKGLGIPKESLPRIFDKFYRVPTGNVHNVKGFGLGLYYVKSVVLAHGGRIQAQSQPGQGTEITFSLSNKNSESSIKIT
jgi:two-component system phosphate regulon sensor histidine kinase PhoR